MSGDDEERLLDDVIEGGVRPTDTHTFGGEALTPQGQTGCDEVASTIDTAQPRPPLHIRRNRDRWLAHLRDGVERAKADHKRSSGTPPYGWRKGSTGLLVEYAPEKRTLDAMVRLRRTGGRKGGGATYQAIADELNAQGSRTRWGTPWRRGSVASRLVEAGAWERGGRAKARAA